MDLVVIEGSRKRLGLIKPLSITARTDVLTGLTDVGVGFRGAAGSSCRDDNVGGLGHSGQDG